MSLIANDVYVVKGGIPLSGTLHPSGSKNAALPILAASLLTDRDVIIDNLPDIRDVRTMLDILAGLGVSISGKPPGTVVLNASALKPGSIDVAACREIRASILLAGPLTARTGDVKLPPPGGDVIGKRRLDTHFEALEQLGAGVSLEDGMLTFRARSLEGRRIFLDEPSVTATENVLMAASVAKGETIVYNAACEPNVQDLVKMLNAMGAEIEGAGTNLVKVRGREGPLKGCRHTVTPDHIEIGSFVGLAACCGGKITIPGVPVEIIDPMMNGFSKLGVTLDFREGDVTVDGSRELIVIPDRGGSIPTIYDAPWPGFSPDLVSTAIVVATQARGTSLIFEKMFESRLFFVDKLVSMGAGIIQCDPHRVVVSGPSPLRGTDVSSPDIRAGMALLTAALCAEGTSTIRNVHQIERGYENLIPRLKRLGAEILTPGN